MIKQLSKKVLAIMLTGAAFLFTYSPAHAKAGTQQNQTELEDEEIVSSMLQLEIKGMHCQAGCANGIDAMLKEQSGIIKSETSFDKSSAVIEYDTNLIAEERIISLIRDRGFIVEKVSAEKDDTPQH